jgi:sn-glycerol 3-phosphate transport system substrate-binding protein
MFNSRSRLLIVLMSLFLIIGAVPALAQTQCTAASPCEIEFWQAFSDHRLDWLLDATERFNQLYPQYNVTVTQQESYGTIINNLVLANEENGDVPEIAQVVETASQFALDSGFFKFANDIIAGRTEILGQVVNFEDFVPIVRSYYTFDGRWASVPFNTSTPIMYNNMTILNEAGITEPPRTWSELLAACEQLQPLMNDGRIEGCATWWSDNWSFQHYLAQQNEYLVNNENGRAGRATEYVLTSPAALAVANFYRDFYERGFFVRTEDASAAFVSQSAPIYLTSSAGARFYQEAANESGFTLQTSPMIYNDAVEYAGNYIGGATLWISNGLETEIEDGAMAYLLFLSNTENSASWHTASGYVPVRTSGVELLQSLSPGNNIFWNLAEQRREDIPVANWFEANPNFLTGSDQLAAADINNATLGAVVGTMLEAEQIIQRSLDDIMFNGRDAMEALSATEAEINEALAEYNLLYAGS